MKDILMNWLAIQTVRKSSYLRIGEKHPRKVTKAPKIQPITSAKVGFL